MSLKAMLNEIEAEVRYTRDAIGKDALDPRVMQALCDVPREEFVPATERIAAFYNGPLPIGYGQTISQPYIVALMTDLLDPQPEDVMLEVGCGSGYQAAVLSRLVRHVYSVEIVEPLAREARARLERLKYENVSVRHGDGYFGLPEHAPYDGIVVTAAAPYVPQPLLDQLKPGAKLVIPLGQPHFHQELMVIEKHADGRTETRSVLGVAFVPLTGNHHVATPP